MVVGLIPPTAGRVEFTGDHDKTYLGSGSVQIIFQDPYASLNPRWTVEDIIAEPMTVLGRPATAEARSARVAELLTLVGLSPAGIARNIPISSPADNANASPSPAHCPRNLPSSSVTSQHRRLMSPYRRRFST